ncbi:MAG: methyltransferase domain-containing protein [Candidatus Lernaella stagnicola]|nr:methyltransferase domain-containing protein [Candidatus Lernaella stagnicola]
MKRAKYGLLILIMILALGGMSACTAAEQPASQAPPGFVFPRSLATAESQQPAAIAAAKAQVDGMAAAGVGFTGYYPHMVAVLKAIDLPPDAVVADIGAGTGVLEFLLLESKRPFGKLYAVDVNGPGLDLMEYTLAAMKYPDADKVKALRSESADVKLDSESIDVAILLSIPTMFSATQSGSTGQNSDTKDCIRTLCRALRPGGKLHGFVNLMPGDPETVAPERSANFLENGLKIEKQTVIQLSDPNIHVVMVKQ